MRGCHFVTYFQGTMLPDPNSCKKPWFLNYVTEKNKKRQTQAGSLQAGGKLSYSNWMLKQKMIFQQIPSFPLADNDDRICGQLLVVWCLSKTHNHQINYSDRKCRLVVETKNSIRCNSQFFGFSGFFLQSWTALLLLLAKKSDLII